MKKYYTFRFCTLNDQRSTPMIYLNGANLKQVGKDVVSYGNNDNFGQTKHAAERPLMWRLQLLWKNIDRIIGGYGQAGQSDRRSSRIHGLIKRTICRGYLNLIVSGWSIQIHCFVLIDHKHKKRSIESWLAGFSGYKRTKQLGRQVWM